MTPDDELDALFGTLKAREAPPSEGLVARIVGDAADNTANTTPHVPLQHQAPKRLRLWEAIGGWSGGAVLAASTLLGLGLGLMDAAALDGVYAFASESEAVLDTVDVLDSYLDG